MSSFVHGIATVQMIDSSGEIVDIKGHDISSLDKTGVINFEHKNDLPSQIVGKILKAKKIYKASDCEDKNQTHFWDMVETPFVYIMAELFDDYCDSAKEAAGQLKYSKDRPHQQGVLGFSVEGSSIPGAKEGMVIKRSIARKVSLTASPCNKSCFAELMDPQASQVKDDFDFIFKSEENAIDMFKSGKGIEMYQDFIKNKEIELAKSRTISRPAKPPTAGSPNTFGTRTADPGKHLGDTKSGKPVFSHAHVHAYKDFSSQDHKDAGNMHAKAAETSVGNSKMGDMHTQKMKLHNTAAIIAEKRETRFDRGLKIKQTAAREYSQKMNKTLTAGSSDAAPSTLVNGAAYQKENLSKKKWSKRAKEEYQTWAKREEFEKFMKSHAPNLTDGEIRAIGHVMALKKNVEAEQKLLGLVGIAKKESTFKGPLTDEDHTAHVAKLKGVKDEAEKHMHASKAAATDSYNKDVSAPNRKRGDPMSPRTQHLDAEHVKHTTKHNAASHAHDAALKNHIEFIRAGMNKTKY